MDELGDRDTTPVGAVIALMEEALRVCMAGGHHPVVYLQRYEELLVLRERLRCLQTFVYTDPLASKEQAVVDAVNAAVGELLTYLRALLRPGGGCPAMRRDIDSLLIECHHVARRYKDYVVDPNAEPAVALCFHRKITELLQELQFLRQCTTPNAVNSSRLTYAEARLFHVGGELNKSLVRALERGRSSDQIDAARERNDDPVYVWWKSIAGGSNNEPN